MLLTPELITQFLIILNNENLGSFFLPNGAYWNSYFSFFSTKTSSSLCGPLADEVLVESYHLVFASNLRDCELGLEMRHSLK